MVRPLCQFPNVLNSGTKPEWLLINAPARGGLPDFPWARARVPESPSHGYRPVMERSGIHLYRLADR